ncbi:MAG: 4Fe-4S binding protein [Thermodesulfobacteriota bacterium]
MVNRKERMAEAVRVQKARRRKQIILGAAFLIILAVGWLYPLIGFFIPACMLLGLGLAAFKGRKWCDWLCPRGSFEDALLAPLSPKRPIPQILRATPMRLGVMAVLMGILTFQIIRLWPDPWAIGGSFVLLLSITTGVGVVLGVIFHQRTWCYLCPIGTMSKWVGGKRLPLLLAPDRCTQCQLCARKCPMQLAPAALQQEAPRAPRGDCLKCSLCVTSCPTAALTFQDRRPHKEAA